MSFITLKSKLKINSIIYAYTLDFKINILNIISIFNQLYI